MEAAVIDKIGALTANIAAAIETQTNAEALYLPPGATLSRADLVDDCGFHYTTSRWVFWIRSSWVSGVTVSLPPLPTYSRVSVVSVSCALPRKVGRV